MKKTIQYLTIILMAMVFTNCDNLLDISPEQSMDLEEGIKNPDVLKAIVYNNYDIFQDMDLYGGDLVVIPEVMGDNFENYGHRKTFDSQYKFQNRSHMGVWTECYAIIKQSNGIITNADAIENVDDRNEIVGQAYAQRALAYLTLMNVYSYMPTALPSNPDQNKGGVPLVMQLPLDLGDIQYPPRATIDAVYTQMLADLDQAILMLENSDDRSYFTRAGANALASRIALYKGDYQDAIGYATAAIDASVATFSTRSSYLDDWKNKAHPENLFYLSFNETEEQEQNGPQNLYTCQYTVNDSLKYEGDGDYAVGKFIVDTVRSNPDDIRNDIMRDVTNGTPHKNPVGTAELIKFNGKGGVDMSDPISIVRLTEMYLNIAEAAAQLDQTVVAQTNLDIIRARAYGTSFVPTINTDKQALIDQILHERRLELLGEGHRLFDLKRNGLNVDKRTFNDNGIEILYTSNPDAIIDFSDHRILAPIPTGEIDLNNNIVQNYNY